MEIKSDRRCRFCYESYVMLYLRNICLPQVILKVIGKSRGITLYIKNYNNLYSFQISKKMKIPRFHFFFILLKSKQAYVSSDGNR